MHGPLIVMLVTTALIVLSAIFVIMEFSLLGARRHRLEACLLYTSDAADE